MLVATFRFTIEHKKKADITGVLSALCSQVSVLPGCQLCKFYEHGEPAEGIEEILLIQRWDSKKNMEKHIISPVFQQLIAIMDFSPSLPELLFHHVDETAGVEMVENICQNRLKANHDVWFR